MVFANDISSAKASMYATNFGSSEFLLGDIASLTEADIPDGDIATASFPCTDLSLAGNRAGLKGRESGSLGEFLRILRELEERRPKVVMLENVPGFATSNGGRDLLATLEALNELGYSCDIAVLDARSFVPQSRTRLFVLGVVNLPDKSRAIHSKSALRPKWFAKFLSQNTHLETFSLSGPDLPKNSGHHLDDFTDHLPPSDPAWWSEEAVDKFLSSMSRINKTRAIELQCSDPVTRKTAYRRTRAGKAVWEIRADCISGCLRTTRGGSSKQAIVEGGKGDLRVRWMNANEYARLQGAPDFEWGATPESQVRFALGDAVCVPAVVWLTKNFLMPLAMSTIGTDPSILPLHRELDLWCATDQGEGIHQKRLA